MKRIFQKGSNQFKESNCETWKLGGCSFENKPDAEKTIALGGVATGSINAKLNKKEFQSNLI